MSLPYRLGCALVLALASPAPSAEIRAVTEEEVLELLEASAAARSLALEAERAREFSRTRGLWPNPELFLSREDAALVTDHFFAVSQKVPLSGRLGLERAGAEADARAAADRVRAARQALRARARAAFYRLLLAQRKASTLEEARHRMAELVRILRAREREGTTSGFDRMRAERELADVEVDRREADLEEVHARLALTALIGTQEKTVLEARGELRSDETLPSLGDLLSRAGERGDVAAIEQERRGAELRGRAASRIPIPEPTLLAGAKRTFTPQDADTGEILSLTFSVPVLNRGRRERALAEADASLARTRHELELQRARAEIAAAHAEAVARREADLAYERAADPAELLRSAQIAYEEGERGILELLDAYRTATRVELRQLELSAGARFAQIELARVAGKEVGR